MGRKIFLGFFVFLFIGLQILGCKEKKEVSTQEGKEKSTAVVFDSSKVLSKFPNKAGFVDVIEPEKTTESGTIHVGGWMYDPQKNVPAQAVVVVVDGKQIPVFPKTGLKREDVAKTQRNDMLVNTGWDTSVSAAYLGKGKHKIEFYALLNDGMFAPLEWRGRTYSEIEITGK